MKLTTEMTFAYGKWTCQGCGYSDGLGYPCYCTKCGRENTTSPKGGLFPKKCVDNRKKNTKRKITPEVAYEVQARDGYCIFSMLDAGMTNRYCKGSGNIEEIHHAYYGIDAQYDEGRNNPDRLVGLCAGCHDYLHSRGGQDYREHCKNYLKPYICT